MKDGCGEPANVELDVSFSRFNVLLVADVHRLAPVSRQRDANQTCTCKPWLSAKTNRPEQIRSNICGQNVSPGLVYLFVSPSTGCRNCAKPWRVPVRKGGKRCAKSCTLLTIHRFENKICFSLYLYYVMGSSVCPSSPQPQSWSVLTCLIALHCYRLRERSPDYSVMERDAK